MKFGVEIKKVRQDAFLSQQDFAKELGVSFSTVNRWETGKTRPTYRAMKAIDLFCKKNQIPLLKYCGFDTFAMVKVWEKLEEI